MLELFEILHQQVGREKHISEVGKPHLVVLQGPSFGDIYYLDGEELVLGSDPFHADIVVRDVEVGLEHLRLCSDGEGYAIRDLGTGKQTTVNGRSVNEACVLSCGDRLSIGDSVLEFVDHDPIKEEFHRKMQRLVSRDYLTGLLAKNRFDALFEQSLEACEDEGCPLGVLMADIDNLKNINDTYGHLLGEFVVGEVGRIIRESLHSEELYATRFGGDEYQAILPRLGKEGSIKVAEEIRHRVEEYAFEREGVCANPTISLGAASYPEDGAGPEALTEAADKALYRAKRAGGNTVCE